VVVCDQPLDAAFGGVSAGVLFAGVGVDGAVDKAAC
jgi:hypothetical protein